MNNVVYRVFSLGALILLLAFMPVLMRQDSVHAAGNVWRGQYFNNENLAGAPALQRADPSINFKWGKGSPDPSIQRNHFSVRWTQKLHFAKGRYRFYTRTDDGVRLFVDGRLLIDKWKAMPPTTYRKEIKLSEGMHAIRMEYFERTGVATAKLWWKRIGGGSSRPEDGGWRGEYYSNPQLGTPPVFVRRDSKIDFDWGHGSPDPRIPPDRFSVRWTRDLHFDKGEYKFYVKYDDGVRFFLDGHLVIDDWHNGSYRSKSVTRKLNEGRHTLRLEYYEDVGRARVKLWWESKSKKRPVGNIITCMRPHDSWIKVYRKLSDGSWQDLNSHGWGPINPSGYIKIDGLPVEANCGGSGQTYRVELWANGSLIRSVGDTDHGQAQYCLYPWTDNYTPWACPAP